MTNNAFDEQLDNIQDPYLLVRLLLEQGEHLSQKLREKIISMGSDAIPPLVGQLNNEAVQMADAPGGGWAPIHAVDLLKELKAEESIQPMLRWLLETNPGDDILHSRLITALGSFGQVAYPHVLDVFDQTDDDDYRMSLCDVLVSSGVKSDRIFNIILDHLHKTVGFGAMSFAIYGDKEAFPHLYDALDNWTLEDDTDNILANQTVIELAAAIQELGGQLTSYQEQKYNDVKASRERNRRRMDEMLQLPVEDIQPQRGKLSRNNPCWCGSGKKYKKCHWLSDQTNLN